MPERFTLSAHRYQALFLLFALLSCVAHAQEPGKATISLRISGFTSEERDSLNKQLLVEGAARIVFACVPAGIVVIEATDAGATKEHVRLRAMGGLLNRVGTARIEEQTADLAQAEALCAAARQH